MQTVAFKNYDTSSSIIILEMAAPETGPEAAKLLEATEIPASGLLLVQTGVECAVLEEEVGKMVAESEVLDGEGVILQRVPEEGSFRLEALAEEGVGGVSKGEGIVLERVASQAAFKIDMQEDFTGAEADGLGGVDVGNAERKRSREQQEEIEVQPRAEDRDCSDGEDMGRKRTRQDGTDADDNKPLNEMKDIIANGSNLKHDKTGTLPKDEGDEEATEKPRRFKKRKIAIFLAYSGVGYQGMQRNPGAITIEGDLEEALFRAGAIAESNFGDPKKIDWMRAARTDKGVSAVGQVVSGNFFIDPPGLVDRVNSYLPKQIRVFGYKRVIHTFSAKNLCDRRRYEYVLPVFAFDPSAHRYRDSGTEDMAKDLSEVQPLDHCNGEPMIHGTALSRKVIVDVRTNTSFVQLGENELSEARSSVEKNVTSTIEATREAANPKQGMGIMLEDKEGCHGAVGQANPPQIPVSQSSFRFDDEVQQRLNSILRKYEGTHNFHNFTSRIKAEDPSARRYMVSFEAKEVFEFDGMEFVRCVVVGQSFMLHQIRKMIGMAVAIMRGCIPDTILEPVLKPNVKFNVPMAPEVGLFLDECLYPAYNNRFNGTHEEVSLKDYEKEINAFKSKFIYSHIARSEANDGVVALWLQSLNDRNYPNFVLAREQGADFGKEEVTGLNSCG